MEKSHSSRNVLLAFLLNFCFAIIEFIFGVVLNSSAVLADAVHDTGDAIAIGLSAYLEKVSNKKTDLRYTLGYKRFSLLGAMITSTILITGSSMVIAENIWKVFRPEPVNYNGMLVLGLIAIVINLLAARLVHHGHTANESMLSLHFLEDILGWLAVILVALVLRFTDWYFLDPLLSLAISVFILSKALPKFFANLQIFLEKAPEDLDLKKLEEEILSLPKTKQVCQLNVWSMDGLKNVAMVHVLVDKGADEPFIKDSVHHILESYAIVESAVEIDESILEHYHHSEKH